MVGKRGFEPPTPPPPAVSATRLRYFPFYFFETIPINNEIVSRLFDEYRFSCESFCRDYKWKPPFEPKEGIQETVKWYENRLNL